ncbi:transcriptional regulator, partial [Vibrio parahaemolyticus]
PEAQSLLVRLLSLVLEQRSDPNAS